VDKALRGMSAGISRIFTQFPPVLTGCEVLVVEEWPCD
jgi:hypothetical protein